MKKNSSIEYAENLSHELMTPLAIIRSKIELLMQSEKMGPEEIVELDSILKTVGHMSRLNKSLILLSKIDNEVFIDTEEFDILELLEESLEHFEDIIRHKSLKLRFEKKVQIMVTSNKTLVEALLTNLIKNAVTHNREQGAIQFNLADNKIIISNTTDSIPEGDLFARFKSGAHDNGGIGLGLSIVKNICDYLNFRIAYKQEGENFEVILQFQ